MTRVSCSVLAIALVACAQAPSGDVATAQAPATDPLADAAALLAAGEAADGPTQRAPLVARLDALQVGAAEGETLGRL